MAKESYRARFGWLHGFGVYDEGADPGRRDFVARVSLADCFADVVAEDVVVELGGHFGHAIFVDDVALGEAED